MKDTQLEKVQASVNKFSQILKVIMITRTADPFGLDRMPFIELPPLHYNRNVNCILSDPVLQAKVVNNVAAFIKNLWSVPRLERKRQKRGWGQNHLGQTCPIGWASGRYEALQCLTRPICSFPALAKIKPTFKFQWRLEPRQLD